MNLARSAPHFHNLPAIVPLIVFHYHCALKIRCLNPFSYAQDLFASRYP
jgi:hypothetical protein